MRTRDWRIFHEERLFIKRIKRFSRRWYHFETANGNRMQNPHWLDFIGRSDYNFYKNGVTREYESRYKHKYSPNKSSGRYRDPRPKSRNSGGSTGKRESDKILTKRIIQEYYEYRRDYPE